MGQETYITDYELHVPAPPNANIGNNIYPKSWILLGSKMSDDKKLAVIKAYNEGHGIDIAVNPDNEKSLPQTQR